MSDVRCHEDVALSEMAGSPVQEDHLHVHILPVLVQEVLQEVGD